MSIYQTRILHARRDRDFGRVEAQVEITTHDGPGVPAATRKLLVSVPDHAKGELRSRVALEAERLSEHFRAYERSRTIAQAARIVAA
ncbi:MAG: hypothetical protein ABNH26_02395 [Celeribacter sp.]|jgi:hypothetical protein